MAAPKKTVRHDPKDMPVMGVQPDVTELKNKDEDRVYRLITADDPTAGVGYYETIGYEVETWKTGSDALGFKFGRTGREGEPMEFRGHLLMSCTKERAEQIEQFGPFGNQGQALADRIENVIVDKDSIPRDITRGIGTSSAGRPYISASWDASPKPSVTIGR